MSSSEPQPEPGPDVSLSGLLDTMKLEATVRDGAAMIFKLFMSYVDAGFTRPEALQLVLHHIAHPGAAQ